MAKYIPKWANPNYKGFQQFEQDLAVAQVTEVEVSELLQAKTSLKIHSYNNDYRYDTLFTLPNGKGVKVEIKEDFTCKRTGNVGLEFECRGKDSGIATTEADMHIYKIHTANDGIKIMLIPTRKLKELVAEGKYRFYKTGGDPGSNSKNYIFFKETIIDIGVDLNKIQNI